MNLPFKIARRYLFAKKSTNAINIITGIAIFGVSVGAAALILILSVFNGFEDLIKDMYGVFNPDIEITPAIGKKFEVDTTMMTQLRAMDGIEEVSEVLEEVAFFEYKENQAIGILRGVDNNYSTVLPIDSSIREGHYRLRENVKYMAVVGVGLRNRLGINIDDRFSPMSVYMPKTKKTSMFEQQFIRRSLFPGGTFVIQQEFDNQYVFADLEFTRDLLKAKNKVSLLAIKLYPGFDTPGFQQAIQDLVGDKLVVKNRFQQQEAFLKLMQIEKWMAFALVSLMMLLVSFNMVGALWLIVLEKKKDISVLKAMGATPAMARKIFIRQGLLMTFLGLSIGFILALSIYYIQVNMGIVSVPGDFIIESYPISIRFIDFMTVFLVVGTMGWLASLAPANKAKNIPAMIREE